ncbi:MAG: NAD-binding protein [Candidatus Micrarchaeota archaeon]|nr:NAD-binding protein [Candidatus Micrarchaeota archaeon]
MTGSNPNPSESIATRVIVILVVATILFMLFSVVILDLISHNIYAAGYYTLSALFDANGEGSWVPITAALAANNYGYLFYSFVIVSILDGLAKVVIIGFLIAAFINLLSNIDLKSKLETITAKHLRGHIIVCGYSMLAERLCNDLGAGRMHFVIIEKNQEKVNLLRDIGFNVIEGDFTERKVLENASLKNAKAIIFATESDFTNLLGIVTAHNANPKIKIISNARDEMNVRKMQRGGADLCLVPEIVAGVELGERISKV